MDLDIYLGEKLQEFKIFNQLRETLVTGLWNLDDLGNLNHE